SKLRQHLEFKDKKGKRKIPHAITFARILRKISLKDLQNAFAEFINAILPTEPIVAGSVARCTALASQQLRCGRHLRYNRYEKQIVSKM
ncbi:MAG: hypothetical protein ACRC2T_07870, partial [Thermoguttaceae bacterium]